MNSSIVAPWNQDEDAIARREVGIALVCSRLVLARIGDEAGCPVGREALGSGVVSRELWIE